MNPTLKAICCAATLVLVASTGAVAANVQVNIGFPAPPILQVAPPLVVVPAAPAVSYAPQAPYDVFYYGGQYYAYNNGWFVTPRVGHPWAYVERAHVPHQVLVVPTKYYKVPPGHLKHRGHGHGHDEDD